MFSAKWYIVTIIKLEILIDLYFLFVIILNGESFTIVRLQE
jgi:hypothetical protein